MKNIFKRVAPLTLAVLCLVSLVLPIYAAANATCTNPNGHNYTVKDHNKWYLMWVFTRNPDGFCKIQVNDRCIEICADCGYRNMFRCTACYNEDPVSHVWDLANDSDPYLYVCQNAGCGETKYIYH